MIIRKERKNNESVCIQIFLKRTKFKDGTKNKLYRIPLTDIKSPSRLNASLRKFLINYVKGKK